MKAQLTKVRTTSAGLVSVPARSLECCIYLIRGYRVMFDADLANLYHVPTKVLNQAVKRNLDRFPEDFMFEITSEEAKALRSQVVTLDKSGEKGRGQHRKMLLTSLPSMVSRCFPPFCGASAPSK
jgi:ORF6N domain